MAEKTLDTRGLRCPLPVIRLEAILRVLSVGEVVIVITDDPIAKVDLPFSANAGGHECIEIPSPTQKECVFKVTRGHQPRNV